ncbi:uncharacterized protein LOC106869674 isoform X1 [Octopus bimaculoides]|nr:uncharacterized protein LOC106869674 isoform X1 [Octopus bimaculoides]|eukprot:XP_014770978.1 PREDICTED: uncharacterized protein LOC106869674 isoform X1 [Octopus bimaculoides]
MSGRGSWNKRSTVGVFDFNEDRKKRYKHKRSQFYMHKTAHFTTTGPPSSAMVSSSSPPVASLTSPSSAGSLPSTMLPSAVADRSNNNNNNNNNNSNSNNVNNSNVASHSVLSPNPSLCATSIISPTSTTSTPISSLSSTSQPSSNLLSRPLLSAVQKSATSSNNVNSGSNLHHHHHHRQQQQHLQIHQQQQHHQHHQQPHHRHLSSVNNTGLLVDNNNTTNNNINNSTTTTAITNNISGGSSSAAGNLNCRRLPSNNSMNVTSSASTSLTTGVANMGLGSNSPTNNSNSSMAGNKGMVMMSPCNMGTAPSSVSFHRPLGLRNDVLASRLHSLCSIKPSNSSAPSSTSSVSMMPLPPNSNLPCPNVANPHAMTTTTALANTTSSTGIISSGTSSSSVSNNNSNNNNNSHSHGTGISSLNNLKTCLPDGNSIIMSNNNTTTSSSSNNNSNIHCNNSQMGFSTNAAAIGSNTSNNTSSNLLTATSGSGPVQTNETGKTVKNTRRHHMATDRIYEFESSPPTSDVTETPAQAAVLIDSQQRKPIWSPAKTKSHESSKTKDNISDSDTTNKEQTMQTPDSESHIELRRGRSARSVQNNAVEQRPVRKCSEFNETQLAFLESQWQLGMVSISRDCWKMIDDTAECIGISSARVKRWIQEYSKAHGLVIDEPVTRKRKLSESKNTDDFSSDTGGEENEEPESAAKKSKKSPSRSKTKENRETTDKKETNRNQNKREQIVGLLGKLSHTCSSLSSLGVETACLAVNKPVVFTLGSKYGTNFLKKEKQLQNKFLAYLAKGKDQPKNNRKKLAEEVKALFNEKFSLCCGSTRTMPYVKLEKDPMFIDIEGFPDGIILKRPQSYGISDLRKILNASEKIQFHLKNPQPNKKKVTSNPTPKKENTSTESTENNLPPPTLPAQSNDTQPNKDLRTKSDSFANSGNKRNNSTPPPPQLEPERPQLELNKDSKTKPDQVPKFGTVEPQFSTLPKAFQTSGNTPGSESFLHSSYMTTNSNTGSQAQNPNKSLQMRQSAAFGSKPIVTSPAFLQHRTTFGSGSSRRKALELARSEQKAQEEKSKKAVETLKPVEQPKTDFQQNSDSKSVAKFDISSRSVEASKFKPIDSMQLKPMESPKFKGIEIAKFKPIESAKFKPMDSKFKPVETTKSDKKSTDSDHVVEKKKSETPKSQKKESENTKSQKSKDSDGKSGTESEVFIVEKVLKKRVQKGHQEVLVKWKGYSNRYNSWEPVDNIFTM